MSEDYQMLLWIYGRQVSNIGDINIPVVYLWREKQKLFMMTNKLLCFISIMLVFSLFGCSTKNATKYISITKTYEENKELKTDILLYDIQTKDLKIVKTIPYTSQYPLTLYNAQDDKIYYTALSKDKKGDEIYELNCKSNKSSQLTNFFIAINNIFDLGDRLFIAGVKRNGNTLVKPYFYYKDEQIIKELFVKKDFNICCASYNTTTNDLYLAGYLSKDEEIAFENQDENGDSKGIDNYIYKLCGETFKKVAVKENCYIKSIVSYQENIMIKWGATYFDSPSKISLIKDNKEEAFSLSNKNTKRMADDSLVHLNSDYLYYINSTDDSGGEKYKLCRYSIKDKSVTVIYRAPNNSAINNAQMTK